MASNKPANVFRSFEQFKADLFPRLTDQDRKRSSKWSSNQIGACMADDAIEALLREKRKADA